MGERQGEQERGGAGGRRVGQRERGGDCGKEAGTCGEGRAQWERGGDSTDQLVELGTEQREMAFETARGSLLPLQ